MTHPAQDITEILRHARIALDAGRPLVARDALAPIAEARPDLPEVRFHLARAQAALGETEAARAGFDQVAAVAPKEPSIWMERAVFAHQTGTASALTRDARKAGLPAALVTMIVAAATGKGARAIGVGAATKRDLSQLADRVNAGDLRGVEAVAMPLLRASGGAAIWGMVGRARLRAGAFGPAAEALRQGLRTEPYAVDLRHDLSLALLRGGESLQALGEARRTAMQAPGWPEAQVMLARAALAAGALDVAAEAAGRALALAPRADAVLVIAAEVALAQNRPADALDLARRRKPDAPRRALLLGQAAAAARQTEAALEAFRAGLVRAPGDIDLRLARAQLLQSTGDMEAAEADLSYILAHDPGHGVAARALAYGRKLDPQAPVVTEMVAALDRPGTAPDDRRLLHYALARVFEKPDPATSFAHLRQANDATAAAFAYDARADEADIARITGSDWAALTASTADSQCTAAPIFVTGMPRSGTTLVEAILSAHDDVRAGGELAVLHGVMSGLSRDLRSGVPVDDDHLTRLGDDYAARAEAATGGGDGRRLTDKSIHTYVHIGQVLRILPRARIVVVHRDPRDTGLSIWRNHFRDGTHRYAASFEGIADHIAQFRKTVAFWRKTLPAGAFHEIRYEALLDAPEIEARALLSACDLPWDDGVLRFHERAGRVDTLSFQQVRQPLYRSSRGSWRDHAAHIAPLIEALEARGLLPDG